MAINPQGLPTTSLQPGSTDTASVKQLQQWLVSNGLMTQEQMNTGPGIYGPATTAAVIKLQQQLGVDNSSGPGYFGPRTIAAVQNPANTILNTGASTATALPKPQMVTNLGTSFFPSTTTSTTPTPSSAGSTSTTPITSTTPPAGTNPPSSTSTTTQMNPQKALISMVADVAANAYNTTGQQLTLQDALKQAAMDPDLVAKYSDASKLDTNSFQQAIQQLQQSTSTQNQLYQTQFENERRKLAESYANAGQAYSGFRQRAQEQLGQQESAVISSSRAQSQKALDDLRSSFEAKYGTAATPTASIAYMDPLAASKVSLSGLATPGSSGGTSLTGAAVGGITGTQPVAQRADTQSKAIDLLNIAKSPV